MEYVEQGRVFCAIESHEGAAMTKAVNDLLGDGVLMYSSDFPHPECAFPDSVDNVLKWEDTIGKPAMRNLMADNAIRYLRLLSAPWENADSASTGDAAAAGSRS
jgi:hypothetical protein